MNNVFNLQSHRERKATKSVEGSSQGYESAPLTYTVDQVAEMLRISRSTAYRCVQTGELPSLRLRRRIVIPAEAIERWLDSAFKF